MQPTLTGHNMIEVSSNMDETLLQVSNLRVHFALHEGVLKAVDDVTFSIRQGQVLGIIGESGCGKSVTAYSIMRLIQKPGRIVGGTIRFRNRDNRILDITGLDDADEMLDIRGKDISMIFQEPMTSLSPVHTIGAQLLESLFLHVTRDPADANAIAREYLQKVGISNPTERMKEYPHQLSGGLRQRVMIAMALCTNPQLLVADEPTTALDVTIQAQILALIQQLQAETKMSVLFITHDLGVISELCDSVVVMYLGRTVESGSARDIFEAPLHPYLSDLLRSIPRIDSEPGVRLQAIGGTVPVPIDLPEQCGYFPRCSRAMAGICDMAAPPLIELETSHFVSCFLYSDKGEA